jgi:hypothetical protein
MHHLIAPSSIEVAPTSIPIVRERGRALIVQA